MSEFWTSSELNSGSSTGAISNLCGADYSAHGLAHDLRQSGATVVNLGGASDWASASLERSTRRVAESTGRLPAYRVGSTLVAFRVFVRSVAIPAAPGPFTGGTSASCPPAVDGSGCVKRDGYTHLYVGIRADKAARPRRPTFYELT